MNTGQHVYIRHDKAGWTESKVISVRSTSERGYVGGSTAVELLILEGEHAGKRVTAAAHMLRVSKPREHSLIARPEILLP